MKRRKRQRTEGRLLVGVPVRIILPVSLTVNRTGDAIAECIRGINIDRLRGSGASHDQASHGSSRPGSHATSEWEPVHRSRDAGDLPAGS